MNIIIYLKLNLQYLIRKSAGIDVLKLFREEKLVFGGRAFQIVAAR
jgi:hypothetical protein